MSTTLEMSGMLKRPADGYLVIPIAAALLSACLLTDGRTVLMTAAGFALFALPGLLLLRSFRPITSHAVAYGVPLGYSLTSLLIIFVVGIAGWNMTAIASAYLLCIIVLLSANYRGRSRRKESLLAATEQSSGLSLISALAIAMLTVAVAIPFHNAGSLTLDGYAFTSLFGHDFILRATDSVALSNSIPSDNYFFNGVKTYNYYVLWYILPAAIYDFVGKNVDIRSVVLLVTLFNIPIFFSLVYYTVAAFVQTRSVGRFDTNRLGWVVAVLLLLSYSYHWVFFLVLQLKDLVPVSLMDYVSRQMGSVSTSWYKDVLFQPHSTLALAQTMCLMHLAKSPPSLVRGAVLGLLLSSLFLTDTVIFLVVMVAFGVWYLRKADFHREPLDIAALCAVAIAIAAAAFAQGLLIIPEYSNGVRFVPYTTIIVTLPAFALLVFGPLAVFAFLGLAQKSAGPDEERRLLLLLVLTSMFFMLFVTEELEGNVFLRKSLMVLRLPLFVLGAAYLYSWPTLRFRRGIVALIASASPTLVTDIYAASNVSNRSTTTYVAPAEMSAAQWLRTHTDPDAVVQSLIDYPGQFDYSLTICFGERKSALGLWKMAYQRYPNRGEITRRVDQIESIFSTSDSLERFNLARTLKIDYIFVGPRERERFPNAEAYLSGDPSHFIKAYASEGVTIYKVRGGL